MAPKQGPSEYERRRMEIIERNNQVLSNLGIAELSKSMTDELQQKKLERKKRKHSTLPPQAPEPRRRSARIQQAPAAVYAEAPEPSIRARRRGRCAHSARPEIYTEEHEKLLGSAEKEWIPFVDGYKDGKRVYDSVYGLTCHQCRQKTKGYRTKCAYCDLVQGQFCGDCLYARYGENVLEARANPDWKCPPCRGICNCSVCRVKNGWAPTGQCYQAVVKLGYKSVAHFLIQTRREGASGVELSEDENFEQPDEEELPESLEKSETEEQSEDKPASEVSEDGNADTIEDEAEAKSMAAVEVLDVKVSKKRTRGKVSGTPRKTRARAAAEAEARAGAEKIKAAGEVVVISSDDEPDEKCMSGRPRRRVQASIRYSYRRNH